MSPTIETSFRSDTSGHRMTVLLDEGLYRHLRFSTPGTGMHSFDLFTMPGKLIYTGDMGTYAFKCEEDMLAWFSLARTANPAYWSEKIIAVDRVNDVKEYSPERFRREVRELAVGYYEDADMDEASAFAQALENDVLGCSEYENEAREALESFEHGDFRFSATDLEFDEYTTRYLWACHAIHWGVKQHRNRNLLKAVA